MPKKALAFDLGASNGRAVLISHQDGKMSFAPVHHFNNTPVWAGNALYWNTLGQFSDIMAGLRMAQEADGFDSVGIDTWGTDFAFIDIHGNLHNNGVCYRDPRHLGAQARIAAKVGKETLYRKTGIQPLDVNTAAQLFAQREGLSYAGVDKLLLLPDLFAYFLTGAMKAEYTIASTTQLLNAHTRQWDAELLDMLGFPKDIFPEIIPSGAQYGPIREAICRETGCASVPVVAVAAHDTASAVVAVPEPEKDFVFISSGTWSLMGTEVNDPVVTEASERETFTNEGGYGSKIRLLKNINGLWLVQEIRRYYKEQERKDYSFPELEQEALRAEAFRFLLNPNDDAFLPRGNMPETIRTYCAGTGQGAPQTVGELVRCAYESLALTYRHYFERIKILTGKNYGCIHIVGGGSQAALLCQMAADACNIPVVAGPIEATAIGNAAVQLIALGEYANLQEAREVIARSFPLETYYPQNPGPWDAAAEKAKTLGIV